MRLYSKHKKPLTQEPSKWFADCVDKIIIPPYPVADIACGYGRNGAYVACKNHPVVFLDIDEDCLNFISQGSDVAMNGKLPSEYVKLMRVDLTENWPFQRSRLGGIICVHFYTPGIIPKENDSLVQRGFFYFETIPGHKGNFYGLPKQNEVLSQLCPLFDILYYEEKEVKYYGETKTTLKVFAVKSH